MTLSELRMWFALVLLVAGLAVAPMAQAATTCTASSTSLNFGTVTGAANADNTAVVTINCSTSGLAVLATVRVRMCLNIGSGTGGSQTNPRRMTNTFGDTMQFQIYRDGARSQIWGDTLIPATPTPVLIDLEYSAPVLGGSGSTTATLFGRVPAQTGLAAGIHNNSFSGIHTRLDYRYAEQSVIPPPYPTSCTSGPNGGTTTFPFTASATVPPLCQAYVTTNLGFGNVPGLITGNIDQTSTIGMTCINRTAWQVGLNNGLNASGIVRRMRLGATANYVSYELYRDNARGSRWGNTLSTDTTQGTGTGAQQTLTVYGRVPAPQTVPAGSYSDTITVTITY